MDINRHDICRDDWPSVYPDNMEEEKKNLYLNRKNAIDSLIEGTPVQEVSDSYKISIPELYRLLSRCVSLDKRGLPYGYTALIPYRRLNTYKRVQQINGFEKEESTIKLTGAFGKLLKLYPDLNQLILAMVFPKRRVGPEGTYKRPKDIHKKFIEKCKEIDISPEKGDYPFNTKDLAKRSVYRYVKQLKELNPQKAVKDFGDSASTLFNTTGVGEMNHIVERPFERVEFDAHRLDIMLAIRYTTLEGDEVVQIIDRIWLLAIIDCATTVTLGYHICLDKEYSALDIMQCYKKAIFPHQAPTFTIKGLEVPEYGYHSQVIPEAKFAIWDEIAMDNAKANRSKLVKENTKKILDSRLNYGPVGTPTRRPFIEKFFNLLEENGFHRTTTTTGSSPNDPRKNNPEENAVKYEVTPDEIEQLIEVLIAQINNRSKKSLGSLSPLEVMAQRIKRKMPFRVLDEEYRDGVDFTTIQDFRIARGSLKDGRRPYVRYEGVDYRNEILAENYMLVNTKITLRINIEDLRFIKAYLPDGSELGLLKAQGKWSIRKHSLKVRKTINKLSNNGELKFLMDDDPIEIYHNHLKEKAKNNKQARNQIAKHQREMQEKFKEEAEKHNNLVETVPSNKFNKNEFEPINFKGNQDFKKRRLERFSFNS